MLAPRKLPQHVVDTIAYLKAKTKSEAQQHREGAMQTLREANERFRAREQANKHPQPEEAAE